MNYYVPLLLQLDQEEEIRFNKTKEDRDLVNWIELKWMGCSISSISPKATSRELETLASATGEISLLQYLCLIDERCDGTKSVNGKEKKKERRPTMKIGLSVWFYGAFAWIFLFGIWGCTQVIWLYFYFTQRPGKFYFGSFGFCSSFNLCNKIWYLFL